MSIENKVTTKYDESQIQVLEGLEAVRKRPGMYIGSTGSRGLHHLVYEIVDNSIDEALAGYCTDINVEILDGDIIRVSDNGRGIPVGIQEKLGIPAVTVVFTVLHAGGKFGGDGYKVSGGLHGVGASVVNALSEWLEVEVHKDGKKYVQRFERGHECGALKEIGDTEKTGTIVTFKADGEIFEETVYDFEILRERLRKEAFLNAGLKVNIHDKRDSKDEREEFCYEGGIKSFVEYLNTKADYEVINNEVIYFKAVGEENTAEVAIQYNTNYNEIILSFANNIQTTEGGTHEEGFKTALTKVFNDYARKFNLIKEADKKLTGDDVREGLTCVISVKLHEAQFEGQTKTKLGNTEMRTIVNKMVYDKLMTFFEENPAVARSIIDKSLSAQKAREAARRAREQSRKNALSSAISLPGKLADCISKNVDETEIYIVEGDSAGGSAKGGRDRNYQAILALWGKMLNVEKAREDKVYGNDKLTPIIMALGTGIGEEFDISKLRYGKVIIMADADVDGSHIRTLLLTFFYKFMRPLIEEGHVYLAQPPLYKIFKGKHTHYAYSDKERDDILARLTEEGVLKPEIQRYKGLGEMDPDQLWETTMDPERRMMVKVEMEDFVSTGQTISILMGDKVGPRREFIEKNAKYVSNLDI
jgi:DNA gyrase subunit B